MKRLLQVCFWAALAVLCFMVPERAWRWCFMGRFVQTPARVAWRPWSVL